MREGHVGSLLVLCTYRPEYAPQWGASRSPTRLVLEPLSLAEASILFRDRFGATTVTESVPSTGRPVLVSRM